MIWLVSRIRASRFYALQIESTDISSLANLLAFVRYEHDGEIHEDVLFCKHLPSHTTAETIFETLNGFMVSNKIDWTKCVGLSTDRARAMVGRLTGEIEKGQRRGSTSYSCPLQYPQRGTWQQRPCLRFVMKQ